MSLSINPYTTKLNHGNAYWMARLSDVVYNSKSGSDPAPDEEVILGKLKADDSGFIKIVPVAVDNAQAMLVEHEQYFCMAFRGTDQTKDWFDNFDFDKVKSYDCEFHEGFYRQISKVWTKLVGTYNELKKEKETPRPLFFTGHSLGGAMATVATALWALDGDRQFTSTYTFGQPRAVTSGTDRTLNSIFSSKFFRFHNNNDIVSRVPFRLQGFRHVGQYVYIDKNGEIHQESGFWTRFQDQVRGAWEARNEPGIDYFADHNIKNYLDAIKNWDLK